MRVRLVICCETVACKEHLTELTWPTHGYMNSGQHCTIKRKFSHNWQVQVWSSWQQMCLIQGPVSSEWLEVLQMWQVWVSHAPFGADMSKLCLFISGNRSLDKLPPWMNKLPKNSRLPGQISVIRKGLPLRHFKKHGIIKNRVYKNDLLCTYRSPHINGKGGFGVGLALSGPMLF